MNIKDYNIVISDIRMPGMNGYEFVKKAKQFKKQVKVILVTAFEINDRGFYNTLRSVKIDAFSKTIVYKSIKANNRDKS